MYRKRSMFSTAILAITLCVAAPASAQDAVPQDEVPQDDRGDDEVDRERRPPRPGRHARHRSDDVIHRNDHDWPFMAGYMDEFEFEMPDVPEIAPLLQRFRFQYGDRMRAHEYRAVAEMERESRRIAREARRAEGTEKAELEAELRSKLQEIFDMKVELREEKIADLQQRVEEEREKLQRRREAREEMIDRRQRMLLGEDDLLEW